MVDDNNVDYRLRPLSSELQKIATEELNEVFERIEDDIQALREWISKQRHLRSRTSDQFLVAFLRGCKYSIEKAKQKIDNFYSMRATLPQIYQNRTVDDPKVLEIIKTGVCLRLPTPTGYSGPLISIIRTAAYDINKYSFSDIIKVGTMISDIQLMEEDNCSVSGMIEIMDMTNVTANHLFHLNPSVVKKCAAYTDEAMPFRHKGIHFVCTIPQFESAYNTLKKLMGNKDNRKIQIHGNDLESLYKFVPKECLPVEYGGTNGTIEEIIQHWSKKILDYRDFFIEEQNYGSDENLRLGEPVNYEHLSGCDGSFRMLNEFD